MEKSYGQTGGIVWKKRIIRYECICWAFRILKIRDTTILISYTFEQLLSLKCCRYTHTHIHSHPYIANRSHLLCIISHWFEIYFDWFNFGTQSPMSILYYVQSERDRYLCVLEATANIQQKNVNCERHRNCTHFPLCVHNKWCCNRFSTHTKKQWQQQQQWRRKRTKRSGYRWEDIFMWTEMTRSV